MINTHIIRIGTHAEKEYFLRATAWYDEVLLNANLVEGTSSATSVFLEELRRFGKRYTIDPATYVFSLNPSVISSVSRSGETRLRRTFAALRDLYEIPRISGDEPLTPEVFTESIIQRFSNAVVSYQESKIPDSLQAESAFLDLDDDMSVLSPIRILAPYFELSGELGWLDVNIRLLSDACNRSALPTWGVICLDGLALDDAGLITQIASAYRGVACEGYMLWLTDFDETAVTVGQIEGLRSMVRQLAGSDFDRPVINMYGGYFSTLLYIDGLTGISHGIGYGERRSLIPAVGGGLPPARYYLKPTHNGINMSELQAVGGRFLDEQDFRTQVCECPICRALLNGGSIRLTQEFSRTERKPFGNSFRDYSTQDVYRLARYHFLYNRNAEIREVNNAENFDQLLGQLTNAYADYNGVLSKSPRHLIQWARALGNS